jgi:serine/threonine protein phosphatase PrpC
MRTHVENFLLDILHRNGIEPTQGELDDFINRKVCGWWSQIEKERMDERLIIKNAVDSAAIVLPNGRVGEQYKVSNPFVIEGVEDYEIVGLDAVGLTFEKTENGFTVQGIAQPEDIKGGDFPLVLRYKPKGILEGEEWLERKLTLILNPDPRTLWKDIPTPRDTEYYKSDYDKNYVKVEAKDGTPRKDIVAASQRGRSHAHEGKPRDDHFLMHYCADSEWYIIAVADGAGSAKYSREGSRLACETAVAHCKAALTDSLEFENAIQLYVENAATDEARKLVGDNIYNIVGKAAWDAHRAIKKEAERKEGAKLKDYATTLLLAICKRFDFGWAVASFWVGDGAMCIYDAEKHTADMLGMPDEGEFAGQTRFLTMPEIFTDSKAFYQRLRFKIYPDFTALMLMTDGVSDPKFETDANLQNPEKWDALWKDLADNGVELTDDNEKSQDQLLEWLNFWDRGNHDDRTIAILY